MEKSDPLTIKVKGELQSWTNTTNILSNFNSHGGMRSLISTTLGAENQDKRKPEDIDIEDSLKKKGRYEKDTR